MTETKQKPLSRYRQEPRRAPRIVLTERDKRILEALLRYRYLTIDGITALFGSRSAMYRRMKVLYHNELVERRHVFDRPAGTGSSKAIYVIDRKGAQVVAGEDYGDVRVKVARRLALGRHHLKHSLALSRFQLALDLAVDGQRWAVLDRFDPDMEERSTAVHVRVDGKDVTVWPDATFTLLVPDVAYTYLLEVDQAERKRSRLEQRFEAYWQYVHREKRLLKQTRGVSGAFVLFVTPSQQRSDRLREIALELDRRRRTSPTFLFLNEEHVSLETPGTLLSKPLFQRLDGTRRFLLPKSDQAR